MKQLAYYEIATLIIQHLESSKGKTAEMLREEILAIPGLLTPERVSLELVRRMLQALQLLGLSECIHEHIPGPAYFAPHWHGPQLYTLGLHRALNKDELLDIHT